MAFRKRLILVIVLLTLASALYAAAGRYSPRLIRIVVGQSLTQKAPAGTDPGILEERLQSLLSETPDADAQMKTLLRISASLEKVQTLTPGEVDDLLGTEGK